MTLSSCLKPPNIHSMGDAVIKEYRTQASDWCAVEIYDSTPSHSIQLDHLNTERYFHKSADASMFEDLTDHFDYVEPETPAICPSPVRERLPRRRRRNVKLSASREQKRERRRVNQERRRNEQIQYEKDLVEDLRTLKGEVESLKVRRLYTSLGVPTKQSIWNIATEYFRLFQRGVTPGAHFDFALAYLNKTMSPDVSDGIGSGPRALLEQWRLLSLYFDGVTVRLNRVVETGAHSVVAFTTTSITISPDTVERAFSHLSNGAKTTEEGETTSLAAKLQGQTLEVHGSVRFDWNSKSERVVGIYSQSDLQTPLLRLFGNLEDVVRVLDRALVTADLRLRT